MKRFCLAIGLCTATVLILWGCAFLGGSEDSPNLPVRAEMTAGDRERDWALVYFQSWRQNREGTYLDLSRRHMSQAISTYFDLQVKIGHSFPDFYAIDRRRRSGCRFLDEIDRLAARFRVVISNPTMRGCIVGS